MTTTPPCPLPSGVPVRGVGMDAQTRCAHYASPLDVVALRLHCCAAYFPCHLCHAALADHPAVPVLAADVDAPRVLCGVCRTELSVREYQAAMAVPAPACPACGAGFNPGCARHADLYFAAPDAADAAGTTGTTGGTA